MKLLHLLARIVPAARRDDWTREWEAEREHARGLRRRREGERLGRSDLAVLVSAAEDALRLRLRGAHPGPVLRDVVFGLRLLRRSPGFTTVAVATLALGVGANTAVFSVVNALLLRPLNYERPDAIVSVTGYEDGDLVGPVSWLNFLDYRERVDSLDAFAVAVWWSPVLRLDEPTRLVGLGVSHEYFSIYGGQPHLGRYLLPDDDPLGAESVVVLSYGLWQQEFGAAPDIVGQSVVLDDVPHVVVGVARRELRDPFTDVQIWRNPPAYLAQAGRGQPWLQGFGRIAEGVSIEAAQQEIDAVAAALESEYPEENGGHGVRLVPLRERVVGEAGSAALLLLGAVVLVLLIACANVANLLLTRGAARDRELAVRAALGAGRTRLVRQLVTESLVLALLGGALGVWLGWGGLQVLRSVDVPGIPPWVDPTLDGNVLLFTLGMSVATGLLFGLAPLRQTAQDDLNGVLRDAGRGASGSARSSRTRAVLATAELALATVLLIAAGLMVRSFVNLTAVDTGVRHEGVLTLSVNTNRMNETPENHVAYFGALRERLASIPGVESAAHTSILPLSGSLSAYEFTLDDRPAPAPGEAPTAEGRVVSVGYFETLGYRLVSGRLPTPADDWSAVPVVVVNEDFVAAHFPDGSPLGVGFSLFGERHEIVGVVASTRQLGPASAPQAEFYTVYEQRPVPFWMRPNATFALRTAGDPMVVADSARAAIWEIDDTVAVDDVGPMSRYLDSYHTAPRVQMALLALFAGLATLLSAIGVAGVVSYGVATRKHEIGIRRALGAETGDVVGLILRGVARIAIGGVALGLIGAWGVTRLMSGMLFAVAPGDPLTFALVAGGLAGVALLAGWWPARRAGSVEPSLALRES